MTQVKKYKAPMDAREIAETLPHRFPFLLIDRVLELEPGKHVTAIKCVTNNEPWAQGHFPGTPIMPGVLIAESFAQASAVMILSLPKYQGRTAVLAAVKLLRVRRVVVPGDVLLIESHLKSEKMGMGRATGTITVDGELAFEGDIQSMFLNNQSES